MRPRHPYELIDGTTGTIVCIYKALTIACRDAEAKNAKAGERRYYVRRVARGVAP
jgi:hypothetical protein